MLWLVRMEDTFRPCHSSHNVICIRVWWRLHNTRVYWPRYSITPDFLTRWLYQAMEAQSFIVKSGRWWGCSVCQRDNGHTTRLCWSALELRNSHLGDIHRDTWTAPWSPRLRHGLEQLHHELTKSSLWRFKSESLSVDFSAYSWWSTWFQRNMLVSSLRRPWRYLMELTVRCKFGQCKVQDNTYVLLCCWHGSSWITLDVFRNALLVSLIKADVTEATISVLLLARLLNTASRLWEPPRTSSRWLFRL